MRRGSCSIVVVCLLIITAVAAVRGHHAMYVGGTESNIPEHTMGHFDTSPDGAAVFVSNDKKFRFSIPYAAITSLEYGQKAGRRLGVALAVSPVFLLSHKRRHYVTIGFKDSAGRSEGVVIEVSKGDVHEVLASLAAKSKVKIEYESPEAQKYEEKH